MRHWKRLCIRAIDSLVQGPSRDTLEDRGTVWDPRYRICVDVTGTYSYCACFDEGKVGHIKLIASQPCSLESDPRLEGMHIDTRGHDAILVRDEVMYVCVLCGCCVTISPPCFRSSYRGSLAFHLMLWSSDLAASASKQVPARLAGASCGMKPLWITIGLCRRHSLTDVRAE